MVETTMKLSPDQHRQCAKALFNSVWTLLEQPERTRDEDDLMVQRAHAVGGNDAQVESFLDRARTAARAIDDDDDRAILLADLTTVRSSPDKTV